MGPRTAPLLRSVGLILSAPVLIALLVGAPADAAEQESRERTRPKPAAQLLPNARQPFEDVLTGGQPTLEQLAAVRELGYATVIDLRPAEEDGTLAPEAVEELGLAYRRLPIAGAEDLTRESAEALSILLEEAERPAIVHCGSGNRVGALFALEAFHVRGASAEKALEVGRAAGLTRLEPAVRRALGLEAPASQGPP